MALFSRPFCSCNGRPGEPGVFIRRAQVHDPINCVSSGPYYRLQAQGDFCGIAPNGRWLGNITGDDFALVGNRDITFRGDPDILNFDGPGRRSGGVQPIHEFWCAHDPRE